MAGDAPPELSFPAACSGATAIVQVQVRNAFHGAQLQEELAWHITSRTSSPQQHQQQWIVAATHQKAHLAPVQRRAGRVGKGAGHAPHADVDQLAQPEPRTWCGRGDSSVQHQGQMHATARIPAIPLWFRS